MFQVKQNTIKMTVMTGEVSQDSYAVGDLSGKIGYDSKRSWDIYLPLFGRHSVAHRSLVIYRFVSKQP